MYQWLLEYCQNGLYHYTLGNMGSSPKINQTGAAQVYTGKAYKSSKITFDLYPGQSF